VGWPWRACLHANGDALARGGETTGGGRGSSMRHLSKTVATHADDWSLDADGPGGLFFCHSQRGDVVACVLLCRCGSLQIGIVFSSSENQNTSCSNDLSLI